MTAVRSAVMALIGLAASGCAGLGGGAIDHPARPTDVILRVEHRTVGPMHPAEVIVPQAPSFVLYGDGRVVLQEPRESRGFTESYTELTVSEDGIQRILREAREAGLRGEDRQLDAASGSDVDATVQVAVATGGTRHVTSAWNLAGTEEGEEGLDPDVVRERRDLRAFLEKLGDLPGWLGGDVLSAPEPFERGRWAAAWAVARDPADEATWPEEMLQDFEVRPWPMDPLAEWGEPLPGSMPLRCEVIEGDDLEELRRHVEDDVLWESDGVVYWLYARPLLPDEDGCSAVLA